MTYFFLFIVLLIIYFEYKFKTRPKKYIKGFISKEYRRYNSRKHEITKYGIKRSMTRDETIQLMTNSLNKLKNNKIQENKDED